MAFSVEKTYSARLRCYSFGLCHGPYQVTKLKSQARFSDLDQVGRTLSAQTLRFGHPVILYVETQHLPTELLGMLSYPSSTANLRGVVFSQDVMALIADGQGEIPPATIGAHPTVTRRTISGFPLTRPVPDAQIRVTSAVSFGRKEVQDALGEEFAHGGVAFINMSMHTSVSQVANTIQGFLPFFSS